MKRVVSRVVVLTLILIAGVSGAAYADPGTFTRLRAGYLVFDYRPSGGNALSTTSNSAPSTGTDYLCTDVGQTNATNSLVGEAFRQVAFASDPLVASIRTNYSSAPVKKGFSVEKNQTFKARAVWTYYPVTAGKGYSGIGTTESSVNCNP